MSKVSSDLNIAINPAKNYKMCTVWFAIWKDRVALPGDKLWSTLWREPCFISPSQHPYTVRVSYKVKWGQSGRLRHPDLSLRELQKPPKKMAEWFDTSMPGERGVGVGIRRRTNSIYWSISGFCSTWSISQPRVKDWIHCCWERQSV